MKKLIPKDAILLPDNAKRVFQGIIFDVYQWPQKLFDGSEHTFEMLKRTDTVNAICVVEDKILVIEDVQPHMGSRQSLPGGRVDDADESIQSAAQREILEETGHSFKNWRLVKVTQSYRKIEWFVYSWLAWDMESQTEAHLDPGEKISVSKLEFAGFKQKVMDNVDYLGEMYDLVRSLNGLDDLYSLPEFTGIEVDR